MRLLSVFVAALMGLYSGARAEVLELHIDADYAVSVEAAVAIELGIETAFGEVEFEVADHQIQILRADHRGNVTRSLRNMKRYLESSNVLAMIGGLHSPPYLAHQNFVNDNEILFLLPWSAAGPITRPAEGRENWFFRVSVDDTRTGEFMTRQAIDQGDCTRVALLLLDSGWGRANHATLVRAMAERGQTPAAEIYFQSSLGPAAAQSVAEDLARSGADCIVMLSNWFNGALLVNALHERIPTLRIFSHWGIMGGTFADAVPHQVRSGMQMRVLQTCGLRQEAAGNTVLRQALATAGPSFARLADVQAPTGFVHGYDIGRILIAAIEQAAQTPEWAGDIIAKRRAVRAALLDLEEPVRGILKTYRAPFSPYAEENPDGHEALGLDDMCMAEFAESGVLQDAS